MIKSMTGFGRSTAQVNGIEATVEMRSVNKRFCEVSVRLPRSLSERESDVQALVKKAFGRGRINVQIQVEEAEESAVPLEVDAEVARGYKLLLEDLRQAAGIEEPVRLEHLLNHSDIFRPIEDGDETAEESWPAIEEALDGAIEELQTMRRQEGRSLQDDLEARINAIGEHLEKAKERAPRRVEEGRQKLKERLQEMMQDDRIDPNRLEEEIAILADKLDVTEECVRLESHLKLFRESLTSDEPVGRKLNFITQEIHREVNTIGSKSNDAELAHQAVQMKEEVEKIREQIQNVE